jgi:hypothetical protein
MTGLNPERLQKPSLQKPQPKSGGFANGKICWVAPPVSRSFKTNHLSRFPPEYSRTRTPVNVVRIIQELTKFACYQPPNRIVRHFNKK